MPNFRPSRPGAIKSYAYRFESSISISDPKHPASKGSCRDRSEYIAVDMMQGEAQAYSTVQIILSLKLLPWSCTGDYPVDQYNGTTRSYPV